MFGDSLMLIVSSMRVEAIADSNGAAGLTFLWMTAPALVAPLFGYLVDRVRSRTSLVAPNVASAVVVLPGGMAAIVDAVTFAVAAGAARVRRGAHPPGPPAGRAPRRP